MLDEAGIEVHVGGHALIAVSYTHLKPGEDFMIAIDAATSEWYNDETGCYDLPKAKKTMTKQQMVNMWKNFAAKYPIISLEDGMGENDWEGWSMLTKAIGDKVQLVGDDLFVTNVERLKMGIEMCIRDSSQGAPTLHPGALPA